MHPQIGDVYLCYSKDIRKFKRIYLVINRLFIKSLRAEMVEVFWFDTYKKTFFSVNTVLTDDILIASNKNDSEV